MCRLSRNSGASTSGNPKGLSRPVMGKLLTLKDFDEHGNEPSRLKSAQVISGSSILMNG
jgi:hypothetical protein